MRTSATAARRCCPAAGRITSTRIAAAITAVVARAAAVRRAAVVPVVANRAVAAPLRRPRPLRPPRALRLLLRLRRCRSRLRRIRYPRPRWPITQRLSLTRALLAPTKSNQDVRQRSTLPGTQVPGRVFCCAGGPRKPDAPARKLSHISSPTLRGRARLRRLVNNPFRIAPIAYLGL